MFPNVNGKHGAEAPLDRRVLVWCGHDLQPSAFRYKPRVSGTENRQRGLSECFPETVIAAEPAADRLRKASRRRPFRGFSHAAEKEAVVEYSARIIPDGCLQFLRHSRSAADQLLQRQLLKLRMVFQHSVQIVDIRLQMPVVVKFHRFGVNERFQCVIGIRQRQVYKRISFTGQSITPQKVISAKYMRRLLSAFHRSLPFAAERSRMRIVQRLFPRNVHLAS